MLQPWRRAAPQALALAVGTLAVLGPYVLTIGRLTNKNTANVMFGEAGDTTLLGVLTLEALGYALDPRRRELGPLPMSLGVETLAR